MRQSVAPRAFCGASPDRPSLFPNQVAAGAFHNLALDVEERVLAWGLGDYGQLGVGHTDCAALPLEVRELSGQSVVDVSAGGWHSVAVTRDGALFTWGRGEYGRLGLGANCASRLSPCLVTGLQGHTIVQASAGGTHTLALTAAGRVFVFGRGAFGRLGLGQVGPNAYGTPVEVTFPPTEYRPRAAGGAGRGVAGRVVAYCVAAGGRHSLAACVVLPPLDAAALSANAAGRQGWQSDAAAASTSASSPSTAGLGMSGGEDGSEDTDEPSLTSRRRAAELEQSLASPSELRRFWWSTSPDGPPCPCGMHGGAGAAGPGVGSSAAIGVGGNSFIPAKYLNLKQQPAQLQPQPLQKPANGAAGRPPRTLAASSGGSAGELGIASEGGAAGVPHRLPALFRVRSGSQASKPSSCRRGFL